MAVVAVVVVMAGVVVVVGVVVAVVDVDVVVVVVVGGVGVVVVVVVAAVMAVAVAGGVVAVGGVVVVVVVVVVAAVMAVAVPGVVVVVGVVASIVITPDIHNHDAIIDLLTLFFPYHSSHNCLFIHLYPLFAPPPFYSSPLSLPLFESHYPGSMGTSGSDIPRRGCVSLDRQLLLALQNGQSSAFRIRDMCGGNEICV